MYNPALNTIIAKLESVSGVAETIAAIDRNTDVIANSIEVEQLPDIDGTGKNSPSLQYGERRSIAGVENGSISFNIRYRHSGSNTTQPAWTKFMQACGMKVDVLANGVSFTPLSEKDITTITIEYYQRELLPLTGYKKIVYSGCMGNCVIGAAGQSMPVIMQFSFRGKPSIPEDVVSIVDETGLQSGDIANYKSSRFYYNSSYDNLNISSWSLDFGNVVQAEYKQDEDGGIAYYRLKNSKEPKLTANPYDISETIESLNTNYKDVIEKSIQINVPNSTPLLQIYAPRAQMIGNSYSSRENLINKELNFQLNRNNGQDATIVDEATFLIVHGEK